MPVGFASFVFSAFRNLLLIAIRSSVNDSRFSFCFPFHENRLHVLRGATLRA